MASTRPSINVRLKILVFLVSGFWFLVCSLEGCGPTYPKERFRESIIRVCRDEYKVDVKVETIGKTIAIYLPLADLLDFTFSISKSASEKINDVILSVSRVALSTDADFNFYCVIAHDIRIPEIQIVIIKSVDDVKRFLLNDISRSEYSKRMLIDIRLNPQSQKERDIRDVFSKMTVDKEWQEQVMNDFFRSEPAVLGDIGYWGGRFYVKDISLGEFLAEQIASRIKMDFRDDKFLVENFFMRSSKGAYLMKVGKRFFKLDLAAEAKTVDAFEEERQANRVFREALKIAATVLHGYKFTDFNHLEVTNEGRTIDLIVSKDNLELFRTKKMEFEGLLKAS